MRTLSEGELNRALLARQLLLERSQVPIPAALEQLGGIQNQYAPNAYIRLWSCVAGFQRGDLTRAYEEGGVVQATLMRGTIHTVSAADYHPLRAGVLDHLRAWARRQYDRSDGEDGGREGLVEVVRGRLGGRSMRRADFQALLGELSASPQLRHTIHLDAEIVRVPPSGTWDRRRADLYGLADDAMGRHEEIGAEDGLAHLVVRYLAGFGPAAVADIAAFTGVPPAALKPLLARLELRHFRSAAGAALVDVPDGPLPPADSPAPVRFLPTWDATLLVHARRTGVLPERFRPLIFNAKVPPSFPTFLVDGRVAGTWRYDAQRRGIDIQPFEPLPPPTMHLLEEEAAGLAELHRDAPLVRSARHA